MIPRYAFAKISVIPSRRTTPNRRNAAPLAIKSGKILAA
jgi:hypothetical protein